MTTRTYGIQCGTDYPDEGVFFFFLFFTQRTIYLLGNTSPTAGAHIWKVRITFRTKNNL